MLKRGKVSREVLAELACMPRCCREPQRGLLPSALPAIPGVESAARYVPGAASVSGDWYDVFTLPSGELCVAMGDVAGHGLRAAVVMGRMRSALRAYALESPDPAEVLHRLDRKIEHFEPGAMATVLYAVCHPALRWACVSAAGHLPPVLACPGQPAALLEIAPDLPIGVDDTAARSAVTVQAPRARCCASTPTGWWSGGTDPSTLASTGYVGPYPPGRPRPSARRSWRHPSAMTR